VKLLFDQNLSYKLVAKISELFPNSAHVAALHLDKASDQEVWEYAKNNCFTIVTKDSDFNDFSTYHGFPPHIIWLRIGNGSVTQSSSVLLNNADQIKKMIESNETGIIEVIK
jgi:predicted nuclease of predicted toxin-antitoxin system